MNISVCIATYNGEKYIGNQLDSILSQLNDDDEIIVSDDGSMDRTVEIIENYNDKRIRLIRNTGVRNVVSNYENALSCVKGDYVFLSDQDDIWMPAKTKIMYEALQKSDLAVCDAEIIDADNNLLYASYYEIRNSGPGFMKNLLKNSYMGCCMAFRRDILRYILPFPENIAMHDMWIGLCVELIGTPFFIQQKLIQYRNHSENTTSTAKNKSNIIFYNQVKYRSYLLLNVIKRKLQF